MDMENKVLEILKNVLEDNNIDATCNLNSKNKKTYNDIYVLLISKQNTFFFDINRKKAYKIMYLILF